MTGQCLCGAVRIVTETVPDFIHDCNCTLCRKSGGAWGYFTSSQVQTCGKTVPVMRCDKEDPAAEVHSCASCFTTTHFVMASSFTDKHGPIDMVGVNMRLFVPNDLLGVEVRFPDGHSWSGQGEFAYRRAELTIGKNPTW